MTLLQPMEKCPMDYYELFLLPKVDNSMSFVTRDKQICQSHMIYEVMASLTPKG